VKQQNGTLSPHQKRAIPALLLEDTITDAAEQAGVNRTTLSRWLADDVSFQTELSRAQDRAIDVAISRLSGEAAAAAKTLADIHKDTAVSDAIRVQAAQAIIKWTMHLRESKQLADRVAALEEKLA